MFVIGLLILCILVEISIIDLEIFDLILEINYLELFKNNRAKYILYRFVSILLLSSLIISSVINLKPNIVKSILAGKKVVLNNIHSEIWISVGFGSIMIIIFYLYQICKDIIILSENSYIVKFKRKLNNLYKRKNNY